VAIVLAALAVLVRYGPETGVGRRLIEREVSGLKLGSLGVLRIEGLSGDPWVDPRLARLTITDGQGVWLDARGVAARWRPLELLERRVALTSVDIDTVTLLHRPTLGGGGGPSRGLPVSVRIDTVRARVEMAPTFAQRRGLYDATGALDVERSGAVKVTAHQSSVLHPGDHLDVTADVEASKAFRVDADAREAEGGALAGSLGLAADQPFLMNVHAAGSLTEGQVQIDTRVGPTRPLVVRGSWNKAGGEAHGTLQLATSSLLTHYRDMVGDEAKLDISGAKAQDGFYALDAKASAQNVSLSARGEANLGALSAGPKGVAVDARVVDMSRIVKLPRMGGAALAGTVTGDRKHWVLAGTAAVTKVSDASFSLARVTGPVRLENQGRDLLISADAAGDGGAGQGLLAALLGARPHATAQMTRFADGRLLMRQLGLTGAGVKASASGNRGILGDLTFKGQASFSNLAMAHPGASGVVTGSWTASQASGDKPWAFTVDARGAGFGSGLAEADRLLGKTPRLIAQASYKDGVVSVASSTLQGTAGQANVAGTLAGDGAVALKLAWQAKGPLDVGPVEISGAVKGSGDLTGTLAAPRADLMADITSIDLPNLPLRQAHLTLTFQHGPAGTDGKVALTAESSYGPAAAASAFRFAGDGLDLTGLAVKAGGVTAGGAVALRKGEPSTADLTLAAGPGALLDRGHAEGRVKIVGERDGAHADISLRAANAVFKSGGVTVKTLEFTADGPLKHLPYKISASGPEPGPWRVRGEGALAEDGADRVASFSGDGRFQRAEFRTLSPAELRLVKEGVTIRAALGVANGRADLDVANVGGAARVEATLTDVDMSLLHEDYVGKLSGRLDLAGCGDTLAGDLDARLTGAGGRDLRGAPPVNGEVKATLAGGAMKVNFQLGNSAGLKADGDVTVPVDASAAPFKIATNDHRPLAGRFAIDGEIKPLWDLTLGGANSLAGKVAASGTLAGTLADPRAMGQVSLDDGKFDNEDTGLQLRGISLRANLSNTAVDVSHFSATDGGKGQINGSGRASLQRDGASSFRADLTGFRLIETDLAHATASGQVSVNRAADGKVQLTGALTIDQGQISPSPPAGNGVTPMDVVEINRPGQIDDAPSQGMSPAMREAPIGLDVSIRAPRGVFVKGRGLNLELSLDAHVGGTAANPLLTGTARVVRGDYNFAGQRFQLDDRGVVYLGSTAAAIRLDLTAVREDPSLTATIKIAGTAAKPTITLSSSPALPQDEILSRVLFGTSASQLSGLEAAQLASAVAGLSGGGGFDLIGGLRSLAHLDRLAVGDSALTGTTIYGGKYLTDKIYLELTSGGREGEGAQLEWRVRKRLSLVGKLGSQGDSQIAIRWRRSY
jgi:translocation and assembly module TamB